MLARGMVALVVVALSAGACSSDPDSGEPATIRWLAVGDSYSAGEGLPDIEGPCSNSPSAYAPLVAATPTETWTVERFVFSACTDAVTDDWPAQLSSWGDGEPNLITATFGGNDIGFAEVLIDCIGLDDGVTSVEDVMGLDLDSLTGLFSQRGCDIEEDEVFDRIDGLGSVLAGLYQSMIDVVGSDGNVFVLGYPAPLADPDSWRFGWCEGISRDDGSMLRRAADRLNRAIAEATDAYANVHFVDVTPAFDGHGRCSGEEWFYGLVDLFGVEGTGFSFHAARPFHPNETGQLAMATALERALETELGPAG